MGQSLDIFCLGLIFIFGIPIKWVLLDDMDILNTKIRDNMNHILGIIVWEMCQILVLNL